MKLLTVNIHSHFDKMSELQFSHALEYLSDLIIRESVDVIALQECSQSRDTEILEGIHALPGFFHPVSGEKGITEPASPQIRDDNFAYLLVKKLEDCGVAFHWSWTGAKIGYDRFDEGLAVLSRYPAVDAESFYYSRHADYNNWKSRKAIGLCVETEAGKKWFYSVHMGWWKDKEEPFIPQIEKLQERMKGQKKDVFLMGDFNNQAAVRDEGYEYVRNLGWQDTYLLAQVKDSGITVPGTIDGWKEVTSGMRIDYIFSGEKVNVVSSEVVFNGRKAPVISDHFGVLVHIE